MILAFFFDVLGGAVARLKKLSIFGGILEIFCNHTEEISFIMAHISTDPSSLMWPGFSKSK